MNRKPIKDILIDIQDEEYCFLTAFESLDEEKRNRFLQNCYTASKEHDLALAIVTCNDLKADLDAEMEKEAERLHTLPRSPLFDSFDEIMGGFPSIHKDAA
jgi:hypothetical protein